MQKLSASWLTAAVSQAREALNGRFRMAQLKAPSLDGDAVLSSFHAVLEPLSACPAVASADQLVHALFDAVLRLAALGDAGMAATTALRMVLPAASDALGVDARRTIAAVSNASLQLHRQVGPHAAELWAKRLSEHGARIPREHFESVGAVIAWQSGMAPLRSAALSAAAAWPEPLAVQVLGAPVAAFLQSPWFRPGATPAFPCLAHRVGGFTGLGGPFRRAPGVQPPQEGVFLVHDHARAFHLHADAYGVLLVAAGPSPGAPTTQKATDRHTAVLATADSLHVQVMALA